MCKGTKILSTVKSGELSKCNNCNVYHFIFNNIYFEFSLTDLNSLKAYLENIDCNYWETKHEDTRLSRKIPIPTLQNNLILMFNSKEVVELKKMLSESNHFQRMIHLDDIDYQLILN